MLRRNLFQFPRGPLSVNGDTTLPEAAPPPIPPSEGSADPSGPLSLASVSSSASEDGQASFARVVSLAAASNDEAAPYLVAAQARLLSRTPSQPPLPGGPAVDPSSTPAPSHHASTTSSPSSGAASPIPASVESDTKQSLVVALEAIGQVAGGGGCLLDLSALSVNASACVADVCETCHIAWRSCPCVAACATCGEAQACCQCAVFNWTALYERLDNPRSSPSAPLPPSPPPSPPPLSLGLAPPTGPPPPSPPLSPPLSPTSPPSSPTSPSSSPTQSALPTLVSDPDAAVEQAAAHVAVIASSLVTSVASTGGSAAANEALSVVLRDRMYAALHAAVGSASNRFAILPGELWLGIGHINYTDSNSKRQQATFHVSEHHTVADLVDMMHSSPRLASLLDGLDYGDDFILIGYSATIALASILSSFAWKEFTLQLLIHESIMGPIPPVIPQVFPHPYS